MTAKCGVCGKFVSSDGVKCNSCGVHYHRQCIHIKSNVRLPAKWHCKGCDKQKTVTPQSHQSSESAHADDTDAQLNSSEESIDLNLEQEIKLIRSQLATIVQETTTCRHEISTFRQEMFELHSTISVFSERLNTVESKVDKITKRLTEIEVVASNVNIAAEVEKRLNDRDQDYFLTDIEVTGIPECKNENPIHIITQVANKLGVTLDEREIVSVERRGRRLNAAASNIETTANTRRPRTIVVSLSRRNLRDQLLRAARLRKGIDTTGIVDNTQPQTIYLSERLTWSNRQLFRAARQEGRNKGWRYIWTRRGNVFARRDTNSQAFRIRTQADIGNIFK